MKKIINLLLLTVLATSLYAQSDKPRNWSTVYNFWKKNPGKIVYSDANIFKQHDFEKYKLDSKEPQFFQAGSLKSFAAEDLNSLELRLLEEYSDVVISPLKALYFTVRDDDCIGVVSPLGEELCPPVEGGIIKFDNKFVFVGEVSNEFVQEMDDYSTYGVAYPVGLFKNVIYTSLNGKTAHALIPEGQYDFCSVTQVFMTYYFYVCRVDDNNNLLWGLYDSNGKEMLECRYKGILYEKGKFTGSDDMDMEQIMGMYDDVVDYKAERRQKRDAVFGTLAAIFNAAGATMMSVAQSKTKSPVGASTAINSDKLHSDGKSKALSDDSKNTHSITEAGNMNRDRRTYDWCESELSKMNTYYGETYNDSQRRKYQSQMRNIRTKWENRGFDMYHSPWEDWDGLKK